MATITKPLTVYIPDTRGVEISPYGKGNLKIGPNVYTYSRLPGDSRRTALGIGLSSPPSIIEFGTCPGASEECQAICYAARPVAEGGVVAEMWARNSDTPDVPPIPEDAKILRLHISGDFDTVQYINNWCDRLQERPDVTMWVYTRSWRVPELLPALERLRALPNVQMFASMDKSIQEMPPDGWRRAWIDGDERAGVVWTVKAHTDAAVEMKPWQVVRAGDDTKVLVCPEETKAVANCEECGFCFAGVRNDVVFLQH